MGELLSAASLLLAVIGLLYSAWYKEITGAIRMPVAEHREDRGSAIREVKRVFAARTLPLAVAAGALAVTLFPDFAAILADSAGVILSEGVGSLRRYDAVRTLFCTVGALAAYLAVHVAALAWRVRRRLRKLEE
jgi:hypothetical protein